jgi:metallo-beta-lactamase class B
MTSFAVRAMAAAGLAAGLGAAIVSGQTSPGSADVHIQAARKAAGQEYQGIFTSTCGALTPAPRDAQAAPRQPGPPPRASWYAEPAKVFDNLYFLGQTEYSAWAVTTSQGIIVIDTIFDYSVEEEVVGGMKKLGLDPAQIKYVIVSHGHFDHSGGAKFLQDKFGAKVILSAADWDLLDKSNQPKPKRDMVATDGMKLTLGDTTLTLYITPGHTLGTISTIIPVKDNGRPHVVAEWGGTAFNWVGNPGAYVTPDRPAKFWFETYSQSAKRFRDIAAKENADIVIANHTNFDGTKRHLPVLAKRTTGEPNPYVVGKEGVLRYMTVVDECAQAGAAGIKN